MLETHPFGNFVPPKACYLILGSFTTKEAYDPSKHYDWYYSSPRNQFWPILEGVYKTPLTTREEKGKLFTKLGITVADIIYQAERKKNSNLDVNLKNIVYNIKSIEAILRGNKIKKIFFTSRFVENKFKKLFKQIISEFPEIELITLPSPSPRFATLTKAEKIKRYKSLLPKL